MVRMGRSRNGLMLYFVASCHLSAAIKSLGARAFVNKVAVKFIRSCKTNNPFTTDTTLWDHAPTCRYRKRKNNKRNCKAVRQIGHFLEMCGFSTTYCGTSSCCASLRISKMFDNNCGNTHRHCASSLFLGAHDMNNSHTF